jgi:hypothetical protein
MTDTAKRWRRVYRAHLKCQDCGHGPATVVRFWLNDMHYRCCKECIKAYRKVILTRHPEVKQ